jgi:bile acid:Na+ symporter, BASS family
VLSVVLTPLAVEVIEAIFGGEEHVNPLSVLQVVVGSVLLPLGIGLAIGCWWPAAKRWIAAIQKVSSLVLLACAVVIIAGAWSLMTSVVRQGTLTAIVLIALIDVAVGHVLGGPDDDGEYAVALSRAADAPVEQRDVRLEGRAFGDRSRREGHVMVRPGAAAIVNHSPERCRRFRCCSERCSSL